MSRVVVVGGSDQGRQVIDNLHAAGVHTVVAVLDPGLAHGSEVGGYPVIGDDAVATVGADAFVVAVGDNATRTSATARTRAAHPDLELVSAIHPAAVIAPDARIGPGVIAMAGAVVSNGCRVGTGVLLGTTASLDHDGTLGHFASLAPGATTGGRVAVGACTAVGLGANVIHGVTIGAHTVVGAGALVLDDLPDLVVAYGVPARIVRPRVEGEPYLSRRAR